MASLRHRVRTLALQALFELDATDHAPDEVVARCVEDELLPPEGERLWTLNTVRIPERVTDEAKVRVALRDAHGIEIGAGLGPLACKIWRVGLMGAGATSENVATLVAALKREIA